MLAVRLCGPRVIARLESIGIQRLDDLAERDPHDLVEEVKHRGGPTHLEPADGHTRDDEPHQRRTPGTDESPPRPLTAASQKEIVIRCVG